MSFCGNLEDWQNPCKGVESEENVAELTSMRNIGKEMANKLTSVGIDSPEKLVAVGAEQIFLKLKKAYPQVCLVHLYALEGAIEDVDFNALSERRKKERKEFTTALSLSS